MMRLTTNVQMCKWENVQMMMMFRLMRFHLHYLAHYFHSHIRLMPNVQMCKWENVQMKMMFRLIRFHLHY